MRHRLDTLLDHLPEPARKVKLSCGLYHWLNKRKEAKEIAFCPSTCCTSKFFQEHLSKENQREQTDTNLFVLFYIETVNMYNRQTKCHIGIDCQQPGNRTPPILVDLLGKNVIMIVSKKQIVLCPSKWLLILFID